MNLYIDMDGVVCDLHTTWRKFMLCQLTPASWDMGAEKFVEERGFAYLKPIKHNISVLKEYIADTNINVYFLSSVGGLSDTLADKVYQQKREWLNTNGFATYPLICVKHKGLKKRFANPHSILIDDTKQNIWDWKENHGLALHVKDKIDIDLLYFTMPWDCIYRG